MKINEEFKVARRKSLIYCPTPDCNSILYKPQKPNLFKVNCLECKKDICFKCGCNWHEGN